MRVIFELAVGMVLVAAIVHGAILKLRVAMLEKKVKQLTTKTNNPSTVFGFRIGTPDIHEMALKMGYEPFALTGDQLMDVVDLVMEEKAHTHKPNHPIIDAN
jgi:hypothetical protein